VATQYCLPGLLHCVRNDGEKSSLHCARNDGEESSLHCARKDGEEKYSKKSGPREVRIQDRPKYCSSVLKI